MDNALKKMDNPLFRMARNADRSAPAGRISGFPGQRLVVVHPPQIVRASRQALLRPFYPTDIGIFPRASGHERRRPAGSSQTIFIHCLEGAGWCELEGERHEIRAHDLLVIPARRAHAYGASAGDPWSIEWFHAAGDGVPEILRRLGVADLSPVLSLRPGAWQSPLFEEALASLEAGFTDFHLLHAALTLGYLLARVVVRHKEIFGGRPALGERLDNAAAFVRENHALSLSVGEMASRAGLSRSRFAVLFSAHTGCPPMDYLIRARMERACQLLDRTDLAVKEIAGLVGYSDPYYFSRAFKKVVACSPKNYRGTHKG